MKDKDLACLAQGAPPNDVKPKIGTTIVEIHATLRSALEIANNLKNAMYIVSGSQIDINSDFSELSQDNIPDHLLVIEHNCLVLDENLQKILATLENAL